MFRSDHAFSSNILVRLNLWRFGVCGSWGELRLHYPVFLGVWLPFSHKNCGKPRHFLISFVASITNWKYEACSWCVEIYLKWALLAWSQGKIPPNLHDLIKWSSVLFQTLPCLEGKTFWGKWDEITRQELSVCMGHSIQKSTLIGCLPPILLDPFLRT